MVTKNEIKWIQSLRYKKYRSQKALFIAEGPKIIDEIQGSDYKIHSIFLTEKGAELVSSHIPKHLLRLISEKELAKLSLLDTPNHALALVYWPQSFTDALYQDSNWVLGIDGLQDPGNLGTVIRTADWFGVQQIVCSEDTVDAFNPKVVQATMGSLFHVNMHYLPLEQYLSTTRKQVFGMSLAGENLYESHLPSTGVLVIGHESKGISKPIQPYINHALAIPRFGRAESLNAGIATAIGLNQIRFLGYKGNGEKPDH